MPSLRTAGRRRCRRVIILSLIHPLHPNQPPNPRLQTRSGQTRSGQSRSGQSSCCTFQPAAVNPTPSKSTGTGTTSAVAQTNKVKIPDTDYKTECSATQVCIAHNHTINHTITQSHNRNVRPLTDSLIVYCCARYLLPVTCRTRLYSEKQYLMRWRVSA